MASRIAYVNGQYLPHSEAAVHVEDRGYQFADGVYEVIHVFNGDFIDADPHLARLERSLREMQLRQPMSMRALRAVLAEVVRRNRIHEGIVYLQITRGAWPRDFAFPPAHVPPSLVITARAIPRYREDVENLGERAISIPDIRWKRRDIKSVSLLPSVLGKQKAREAGCYEAIMIDDDGFITEGTSSNFWIVGQDGVLRTRHLSSDILAGCTRGSLMALMEGEGIKAIQEKFTLEDALAAREAFVTSATSFVKPIVAIDDKPVGNGKPGTITRTLHKLYTAHVKAHRRAA
jgi:D-alanine transaminase